MCFQALDPNPSSALPEWEGLHPGVPLSTWMPLCFSCVFSVFREKPFGLCLEECCLIACPPLRVASGVMATGGEVHTPSELPLFQHLPSHRSGTQGWGAQPCPGCRWADWLLPFHSPVAFPEGIFLSLTRLQVQQNLFHRLVVFKKFVDESMLVRLFAWLFEQIVFI